MSFFPNLLLNFIHFKQRFNLMEIQTQINLNLQPIVFYWSDLYKF